MLWIFGRGRVPGLRRGHGPERRGCGGNRVVPLSGQAVSAVVSTVLWAYLASIAILLGGELNVPAWRKRR